MNHPEMPEHRHRPDGSREAWGRMTFGEILDQTHDLVRQIEDALGVAEGDESG